MLRPDKHMNLDISVVNITVYLLEQFKRRQKIGYDELLEMVEKELNKEVVEVYPYAINFLFLLGRIEYDSVSDCLIINEVK